MPNTTAMPSPPPLTWLTDDDILYLLLSLDVPSLLRIRQTCKRIYAISQAKQVWVNLYNREIIQRDVPYAPYCKPGEQLDADILERLVVHSLKLEQNVSTRHPPVSVPFHHNRSITWVRLIRSEWLLVASSDDISSVISLWSVPDLLTQNTTQAPLTEGFLSAPVIVGAIDVRESAIRFALELRGRVPQIEIFSIVRHHQNPRICRLQTVKNVGHLRFLQGDIIGVSLVHDINLPCIVKWTDASLLRLRDHPDVQGGAVAMHLDKRWVGVIRRSVFEFYTPCSDRYQHWRTVPLPHNVGSASFSSISPHYGPPSLRVCITSEAGIFVYEVICDIEQDKTYLESLWKYRTVAPPPALQDDSEIVMPLLPIASSAILGVTGNTVSWIEGDQQLDYLPVRFVTARIPQHDLATAPNPTFDLYNEDMPALFSLGVYDFDEARGISVLGSAFGEIALYDFSGTDPRLFAQCLMKPPSLAPCEGQEVLSSKPFPIYSSPPFPLFSCPEYLESDTLEFWNSNRPTTVPEGWTADLGGMNKEVALYHTYCGRVSSFFGWPLEHSCHFYGRPIPLLYRKDEYDGDWFICTAGGLLFMVCQEYWGEWLLANPGVTLQQLALSALPGPQGVLAEPITSDESMSVRQSRFLRCDTFEWERKKRNRARELYERGGRVDPVYLEP